MTISRKNAICRLPRAHAITSCAIWAPSAEGESLCIGYFPTSNHQVHNANTLAASFLARTYSYTRTESYLALAEKAIQYTAKHQRPDSSWYYGEAANLHWVDNFHTAYVLDSFKHYSESTGDDRFNERLMNGYQYWKTTFFLPDGTPKYYNHKTHANRHPVLFAGDRHTHFFLQSRSRKPASGTENRPMDHHAHAGSHWLLLLSPVFAVGG